jgi:tetratricopeptide (TPR) repeat protein
MEMYLTPKFSEALGEIQGSFPLSAPIPVTSDLQANSVQAKITQHADLLAVLALAQSEDQVGHTLEALEYYQKAAELAPESDLVQFFIGREYLFTIERKPIPPAADPAFEQQALDALHKALQLNPQNSSAYIALGAAYVKQAQPLIAETTTLTGGDFQKATGLLDQAQAAYEQVLQPGFDTAQYGAPVQGIARLGVGQTWLLRGNALQENGQTDQAASAFHQAIQILQQTPAAFEGPDPQSRRYLAQNYQYLGNSYQWAGYLADLGGNYPAAIQAYQQATAQLSACVAMSKVSSDRVIQSDIVRDNCQPMLQTTEKRLTELGAGP